MVRKAMIYVTGAILIAKILEKTWCPIRIIDKQIEIQINKKQKAFKKFLGNELNLKTIPNIHFYPDDTLAYTEKINHLIKDAGLDTNNSDTKSP